MSASNKLIPLPPVEFLEQRFSADFARGILTNRSTGKVAGTTTFQGYRQVVICRRAYRLHRILFKMAHGHDPEIIDHINGDQSDNRLVNLRSVTAAESQRNLPIDRRNTSGVPGVYYEASGKRWVARIYSGNKKIHLGSFRTIDAAAAARKVAERQLGFHPNHGRPN